MSYLLEQWNTLIWFFFRVWHFLHGILHSHGQELTNQLELEIYQQYSASVQRGLRNISKVSLQLQKLLPGFQHRIIMRFLYHAYTNILQLYLRQKILWTIKTKVHVKTFKDVFLWILRYTFIDISIFICSVHFWQSLFIYEFLVCIIGDYSIISISPLTIF